MGVFDMFSKRHKPLPDVFVYDQLPQKLRNQVLHIWRDTLLKFGHRVGREVENAYLQRVHNIVCREHGLLFLVNQNLSPEGDIVECLLNSKDFNLVMDTIEIAFLTLQYTLTTDDMYGLGTRPEETVQTAIEELNHRFRENGVGYEYNVDSRHIIRIDNQFVHQQAVQPELHLLANSEYKTANGEFLEAFDDYKKGDYDDCLTKCCTAFESVIKIVCHEKQWPYSEKDAASSLITTVIQQAQIPGYFTQPLTIIATLRNRLSTSHGAGVTPKNVPDHLARYALHATASAIVLIVDASK